MYHDIFCVFDSKAKLFLAPFVCANSAVAVRSFERAANEPGHDFNTWPTDYCLFRVGRFSEENGMIVPVETPESLGLAAQYVRGAESTPFTPIVSTPSSPNGDMNPDKRKRSMFGFTGGPR